MSNSKESLDRISHLIEPYGGQLVDLLAPEEEWEEIRHYGSSLQSLQLSRRAVCDLELMASGGFSPLDQFMGEDDYQRVLEEMRLSAGQLFPIPVTLPIDRDEGIRLDQDIALRDSHNELLCIMTVEEIYEWDLPETAEKVFGKNDLRHPLVAEMHRWGKLNISGPLRVLRAPPHHDFQDLRLSPRQTRDRLSALGKPNVVAFQTRNPLHRVHEEMASRAIEQADGVLLLHPAVGMTKPGDVDHYTRVRTYRALASNYLPNDRAILALLPLAMRLAGPREALWHALIRRNYGANYLIVGRDHASPGPDSDGKPFYPPYEAQAMVAEYSQELGVEPISFRELVYLPAEDRYEEADAVAKNVLTQAISGTELREEYLNGGKQLPAWYARAEVAEILADAHPPKHRHGVCIWFTGLSGAGKSTTAEVLTSLLLENGRRVTLLDGDVVRTHLSKGLSFSHEDRDTNVRRIGFVASEIVRHGGVAVCAAVSPYRAARNDVRRMVGGDHFIEVFVDTPLEICEARDTKGMYAMARRGDIQGFTGIDDPYEIPEKPEMVLGTTEHSPEENSESIIGYLRREGFLR